MTDNSLLNLGELSRPATVLVEKISDAVGGIFKPHQIVRVAKAEAEAEQIRAESQIQIGDIHRRAMHRFLEEEAKKQLNIESITQQALPFVEDDSSPEQIKDDWITNFFDKCRIVSDKDMQNIWAKILAGEANAPGTFARATINTIANLESIDAILFEHLCKFGWMIANTFVPLIFDDHNNEESIYRRNEIIFDSLSHLESLGLIQYDNLTSYSKMRLSRIVKVRYHDKLIQLMLAKDKDNTLDIGHVILTRAGDELAAICDTKPIDGFFEFVYEKWTTESLIREVAE